MTRAARLSGLGKEFDALVAATSSTMVHYSYNATAGQTSFSGADVNGVSLAYTVGSTIVALNGFILQKTVDYAATTGTSVVLVEGAALGDLVQVVAFGSFLVANCYTKSESDAKVLGTVSQVGGVPTGAIIETGTNANGSWTKWADGTMMCSRRVAVTRALTGSTGSLFTTVALEAALSWAQPFTAVPNEIVFSSGNGTQATWWSTISSATASLTPTGVLMSAVSQASANYTITYTAWGRWF